MMLAMTLGGLMLAATPQDPPCPAAISLDDALRRAEVLPTVLAHGDATRAAGAERDKVSWLHGTTQIQTTPGVRWWPTSQLQPEGTVGIAHQLVLGDLGGARRKLAAATASASRTTAIEVRLQVRLHIAARWVDRWRAEGIHRLAKRQWERSRDLADRFAAVEGLGVTRAEAVGARVEATSAQVALLDAEGEITHTALALAESLGCSGEVGALGEPWPSAGDIERLGEERTSPTVKRLESAVAVGEAANELVTVQSRPRVGVGMTAEVDGTNTARTLSLLSGDWALFDGGHEQRAQVAAEVEVLRGQILQAQLADKQLLALYVHEIEHLSETARVLEEELLPQLREVVALQQGAVDLGEATAATLVQAQQDLNAAEQRATMVRGELAEVVVSARLWSRPERGDG